VERQPEQRHGLVPVATSVVPTAAAQERSSSTVEQTDEAGFTLIEIIVVVSIIAMIIVFLIPQGLSTSPGLLRAAEAHTQAMISATRALAESNAGQGNTGATLQFSYDTATGETVERVYYNRPISSSGQTLTLDSMAPAYRFKGKVSMPGVTSSAPFAIFMGSAGHASASGHDFADDPEDGYSSYQFLSNEPANCTSLDASMPIQFTVGSTVKIDAVACYHAGLWTANRAS
jgi:prepilin-type N-terminal cleavage/methylation domain-containing protein